MVFLGARQRGALTGAPKRGGLWDVFEQDRIGTPPIAGNPSQMGQPDNPPKIDPEVERMLGNAPEKKGSTLRDVLGGALAVISDAAAAQGGRKGTAVDGLAKAWGDRRDSYKAAMDTYRMRQNMAALPGMNSREFAAYMTDPKAWGSHMADAATSRYQAATLNPGDTRFLGQGNGTYQAPTRGQQFAQSLGFKPASPEYNTAIRDQELGGHGPTAFSQDQQLANLRNNNAIRLEGVRQGNRQSLRGAPTYRDLNPPPPRPPSVRSAPRRAARPTATGPNGERVEWDGKAWVPVR